MRGQSAKALKKLRKKYHLGEFSRSRRRSKRSSRSGSTKSKTVTIVEDVTNAEADYVGIR